MVVVIVAVVVVVVVVPSKNIFPFILFNMKLYLPKLVAVVAMIVKAPPPLSAEAGARRGATDYITNT